MTALKQFQRLEATGLWRPAPDAQRREVIVSLGDATLTISSTADQALAHWSLAAIERSGARALPAIYHPEGDETETLELEAPEMIEAIDRLRSAVRKARPRTGRLRLVGALASVGAVAALCVFWLPGALVDHALRVVPDVTRAEIGDALLLRVSRVSGPPCLAGAAREGLLSLGARTGARVVSVVPGGVQAAFALPGGRILLNRALIEDYEAPDVAAGFILAEQMRAATRDPLRDILENGGIRATATLLTTGHMPEHALDQYAEAALVAPRATVPAAQLLPLFEQAQLSSTPYAYALDLSGETTLPLIEGDPVRETAREIMPDSAWLRLQTVCGA